ncbi:MAG: hypothetical protein IIB16_12540 [Chloroflexi bacterium]|nr:hypothetical protein [Chloroflexota bacterium]
MGFVDLLMDAAKIARSFTARFKFTLAMAGLALLAVACSTGAAPPTPVRPTPGPAAVGALTVVLMNHGGEMEGHTPRGFQGQGTGLFAGDNLNPSFPNGDGVQIFLTFDLEGLPAGDVLSATLRSENFHLRGSPLEDLGPLRAQEVRYDRFSSALWNLSPLAGGHTCTFATKKSNEFQCDVTDVVRRSVQDGYMYAQLRLRLEKAGDGDGETDLVAFYKTNSNTNEPGIFEVEITLTQ